MERSEIASSKPLLARQPIFDEKLGVAAYELLFRNSEINSADPSNEDQATSQVLLSAFSENDISQLTGMVPGFVNFTKNLLLSDIPFDRKQLVIEVLEDITDSEEIINALSQLKDEGYTIALDDFIYSVEKSELIKLCDIIKVDLRAYENKNAFLLDVKRIQKTKKRMLAEKVETHEEFELCKQLGFELFQGYFFAKPQLVKSKQLSYNKEVVLSLISRLQDVNVSIDALEEILVRDPELTYKLLKLVNSAAYTRGRKLKSVKQALTWLGLKKVKSWVILLSLSQLDDKPVELTNTALIRAKTCELLGAHIKDENPENYFTTGMLSCLPAFMDMTMPDLLEKIPLISEIKEALLYYKGYQGFILATVMAHEYGWWEKINWKILQKLNIKEHHLSDFYREAVTWSNDFLNGH